MTENPTAQTCPSCGVIQEPLLVIRSSGVPLRGWMLRCRFCDHEWPHRRTTDALPLSAWPGS